MSIINTTGQVSQLSTILSSSQQSAFELATICPDISFYTYSISISILRNLYLNLGPLTPTLGLMIKTLHDLLHVHMYYTTRISCFWYIRSIWEFRKIRSPNIDPKQ